MINWGKNAATLKRDCGIFKFSLLSYLGKL